jgi:hypothetical protein
VECALIAFLLLLGSSRLASAFASLDRDACWSAWTNAFYFTDGQGRGYFRLQEGTGTAIGFFEYALCIQTVEDATNYASIQTNMVNALCAGFTNVNGTDWSWDPFNDDLGWASIAFSRAYQLTGNVQWKTLAKNGFDVAYNRGFDPTDGGMFQSTDETEPKATVGSQTALVAAWLIYQSYGDSNYLSKAQAFYQYVTNNCFIAASGEVMGAADTPASGWGLADSDNGMFAIASLDLGYTNNAYRACDFVTNYWSVAMDIQPLQNTADGPQNGVGLQGMARAARDTVFQRAALDNAWSWRNSRNLVHCAWNQRMNDTNHLYCGDCMSVVMGMMNVPPSVPSTLPVTAVDVAGSSVTFSATGFSGSNLVYQWQVIHGGVTNGISGQTNTTLTLSTLQLGDSGFYQLQASNSFGIAVSAPATLTVSNLPAAVNNVIVSCAAQTGLPYGSALTPSWTVAPNSVLAGLTPTSAGGNFNLSPYYTMRKIDSLTAGSSLTLAPVGAPSTNYENYAVTFTAASSLVTIAFVGTDLAGGDNTIFIDDVNITSSTGASVTVPDGGFEIPSYGAGGYQYNPSGGSWTFSGSSPSGSGIVANGSIWGNVNAPEGTQAAFLQANGTITQSIPGFTPGVAYTLSFWAVQRPGNKQTWSVKANSATVGSFSEGSFVIPGSNYVTCGGGSGAGSNLIYMLPSPAGGYDLTNITVYGGWASSARDAQAYTVYYSTVLAPNTFIPLGSVTCNPVNTNYNPLYYSFGSVPAVTRSTFTSATGVLASNVAALMFNFTSPVSGGYGGYAQIAAYGIPLVPTVSTDTLPATAVDVVGSQVTFMAAFTSANPLAYQWQMISGGLTNVIAGATNTTLMLSNLQLTNTASYQLQASNANGVTYSTARSLTVNPVPAPVNNVITSYAAQTGMGGSTNNFYTTWTVAPGSLIAGQAPSSVGPGDFSEPIYNQCGTVAVLTDGSFGFLRNLPGNGDSPTEVACGTSGAGQWITYTLTGSATGYNLTNITVYGGWGDAGRDQQAYTVYYSTVSAPTNFSQLSAVNYLPANPSAIQCATRATLTPAAGVLATNVAAVKFDFTTPAGENGFEGYAEIELFGMATISPAVPATLNVALSGADSFKMNIAGLVAGRNYQVQSTTNLAIPVWVAETNFVAGQAALSLTNSIAADAQKFYRVVGN